MNYEILFSPKSRKQIRALKDKKLKERIKKCDNRDRKRSLAQRDNKS